MDIVGCTVITMRQDLHQQTQVVQVMEVQTTGHTFVHQVSYKSGRGRYNAIIVPPSDILGASIQPQLMQIVQQKHHLQMPVCPQNKKTSMPPMWQCKKAEVITRRIGRPIMLNTVLNQYQVTHHIG
jgi:hypothetical protein